MDEELLGLDNEEVTGEEGAASSEEKAGTQGEDGKPSAEKKYTDEDVNKIIARRIASERKRLSKLFNEGQQESELEIRERKVLERELKADAKDALIDDGLPASLASLMNYSSKEEFEKSYKDVTSVFQEALGKEFKRRLAGPTPRRGTTAAGLTENERLKDAFSLK